jgi:hypothetical protein
MFVGRKVVVDPEVLSIVQFNGNAIVTKQAPWAEASRTQVVCIQLEQYA